MAIHLLLVTLASSLALIVSTINSTVAPAVMLVTVFGFVVLAILPIIRTVIQFLITNFCLQLYGKILSTLPVMVGILVRLSLKPGTHRLFYYLASR